MHELEPRFGCYLFLGLGDFPVRSQYAPDGPTQEWTCCWDADEWKRRLRRLHELGCNTLFMYLMGSRLPFGSSLCPECIEADHPNVERDFFQGVIDDANEMGIDVVAVFTTTGHAHAFSRHHPELAVRTREGACQSERGIVCHHLDGSRRFAVGLIEELLSRYSGFAGVSLHPPEFLSSPCFCDACCEIYRAQTGADLRQASDDQAKRFFMETNLAFQNEILEPLISRHLPDARRFVFTVPPIFDEQFESFGRTIPADHVIIEWCYDLSLEAVDALIPRLKRFRRFGHAVWFMPTGGYWFIEGSNRSRTREENEAALIEQLRRVRAAGIDDLAFFVGPHWWPSLDAILQRAQASARRATGK